MVDPMKESRTQHGNVDRTFGRVWMLAAAFAVSLITACGASDSTGPTADNSPVGNYSITTINGKTLPVAMVDVALYKVEITSGSLSLTADGKYSVVQRWRETIPNNTSNFSDSTFGTWSQSGAQIMLKNAQDTTAKSEGTWAAKQLTFALVDGSTTTTYVYTKP
jgi:hypothetical protein